MLNLPIIKWHAQELCKLLEQEPNNGALAGLLADLERTLVNSSPFKDVDAAPPSGVDKQAIQDDDI